MIFRKSLFFLLFVLVGLNSLGAIQFDEGNIRLVIHERTGRFSLFYLADPSKHQYEPFFVNKDPLTSYISVNVNNRTYRPDKSLSFRTRVENNQGTPSIVYESRFLMVTQVFSFIKTANSPATNGVKIAINLQNKSGRKVTAGLRVLFDTYLGEGRGKIPFIVNSQNITAETIIQGDSGELFWVSRGLNHSIMGSITNPPGETGHIPDYLHFVNWKKIDDVIWKAPFHDGRSFTNTPYSIDDSAVCYYYEGIPLEPEQSFTSVIFLATEDHDGFIREPVVRIRPPVEIIQTTENENDLQALHNLMQRLDRFISGEIFLSDRELAEIDLAISRLKARHGLR